MYDKVNSHQLVHNFSNCHPMDRKTRDLAHQPKGHTAGRPLRATQVLRAGRRRGREGRRAQQAADRPPAEPARGAASAERGGGAERDGGGPAEARAAAL